MPHRAGRDRSPKRSARKRRGSGSHRLAPRPPPSSRRSSTTTMVIAGRARSRRQGSDPDLHPVGDRLGVSGEDLQLLGAVLRRVRRVEDRLAVVVEVGDELVALAALHGQRRPCPGPTTWVSHERPQADGLTDQLDRHLILGPLSPAQNTTRPEHTARDGSARPHALDLHHDLLGVHGLHPVAPVSGHGLEQLHRFFHRAIHHV